MIERYFELNVKRFYEDYKGNLQNLKQLKKDKEHVATEGGMDYSTVRVSGGNTSDPTVIKVIKSLDIDRNIREMEEYFITERMIYDQLDEEERLIADAMKEKKGSVYIADRLCVVERVARVKISRFKAHVIRIADWATDNK